MTKLSKNYLEEFKKKDISEIINFKAIHYIEN